MRTMWLLGVACLVVAEARAADGGGAHMPLGAPTDPPHGLRDMCRRDPGTCWDLSHPPASPGLDDQQQIALLKTVERQVNSKVEQKTDRRTTGQDEVWRLTGTGSGAEGDCEDLALEKMHDLLQRGFPSSRLFLAVGYQQSIGLHTVLVASTSDGDLVLDSRSPYLERWTRTEYAWVVRQRPGRLMEWHRAYGA